MGSLSPWHWIVLAIVVILLFGSRKLPDAARGLGRSMRILKSEMEEMRDEGSAKPKTEAPREITSGETPAPAAPVADPAPAEEKKSA
ncbi:MAG: Sec-independent protein translocase subunit TatA [Gordonia sp. (in: high G+C Gram-positive bacteria)]